MAAGRPVILAIDGVIRKVVEDADAGVFVPPGDPIALADTIARLYGNQKMCRTMGANGRRCVEAQFDRAVLAEELAELMEELSNR